MPQTAISASGITYSYRTEAIETIAVDDASFDIEKGGYASIQGPSGCGKSSLLSMLALVERPTSGALRLLDRDLGGASENDRARFRAREIGMIFQSFHLIPELTVAQNLMLRLRYRDGSGRRDHLEATEQALDRLGLLPRKDHFPDQLSGGQQQRVAIARALVSNPSIVLADEPTGNLDSRNGEQVMDLFDEIHAAGVTVVLVTHSQAHACRASTRFEMLDGRLSRSA